MRSGEGSSSRGPSSRAGPLLAGTLCVLALTQGLTPGSKPGASPREVAGITLEVSEEVPETLLDIVRGFRGRLHFAAREMGTGRLIAHQAEIPVQTASVVKVPIMVEVFAQVSEGRLSLGQKLRFDERNRVPGAGILQDLSPDLEVTLGDAVTLMIVLSDNSATNMVIDQVGIEPVNRRMGGLSLKQTFLNRKVYLPAEEELPEERARFGLGVTTAGEMLALFEKMYRGELVDPESSRRMIDILLRQRDLDQIPRHLVGPEWAGVKVAHKTGALNRVRNDVGIVYTPSGDYVLSLFAQDSEDEQWTPDNEATLCLARLARAILIHFRESGDQRPAPSGERQPSRER
jgi:beta-lactamase class A